MGFLTDIPQTYLVTSKGKLAVNPAFDLVLEAQKLFKEGTLSEMEKIDTALCMFTENDRNLKLYSQYEKCELLNRIYEEFVHTRKRPSIKKGSAPVLDFELDGEYIYASFMQNYGIDLVDSQGKLSWKKFIALFEGLSSETKIKQIMRIRDMEVPVFNGKNQKQIQDVLELKSYYALPVCGGGGKQGLDLLFSTLERMAVQ